MSTQMNMSFSFVRGHQLVLILSLQRYHHTAHSFNILEQARSAVKASIKVDISRPDWQEQLNDRAEAR